ncbi:hypothetical protein GGP85_003270 [Salinibacter ruber]|uniref:hypothetical protein n=1 Tax=Salinibacter ruber TaxID=146919 RepID=UPI0021697D1F|nr:hypothetical protein [Salinibacter ruber]MCS3827799.1 hypothetical protein [Salinibacter ruber]
MIALAAVILSTAPLFGIVLLVGAEAVWAQPSFINAVLPNGVPEGGTGTNVVETGPKFFGPASGDYCPDKPAGRPPVDLASSDPPFGGRLLNGQTKTESGWDAGALESTARPSRST